MKKARKFYRQLVIVEILSEDPPPTMSNLADIHYEINEGHCSGLIRETGWEEIDAKTMKQLLLNQGTDPDFFDLMGKN